MLKDKDEGYWALWATDFPFMPIPFDTVLTFDYQAQGSIVNAPIENNAFASYNKKIDPIQITLDVIFEGNKYWQAAMLVELRLIQNMAAKLVLVTPSGVYTDMTLETIKFNQAKGNNNGFLALTIVLREVMDISALFSTRNIARHIQKGFNELAAKVIDHVTKKDIGMVQTQGVTGFNNLLR